MSTTNGYIVTVTGPKGVKHVHLTEEQVEFFGGDPYSTAAWLAYCDLWVGAESDVVK